MISKDHSYVQEATCAKFHLDTIKESFSILFKYINPSESFGYRGPNNATIRERSVHALNGVYKLLQNLDNEGKSPVIACPSEELRLVLPANGQIDYIAFDNRVKQLEDEMNKLKYLESKVNENTQKLQSPPYVTINHAAVSRLQGESHVRSRSSSVSSFKRKERSDSESSESSDDESHNGGIVHNKDKRLKLHDVILQNNAATGVSSDPSLLKHDVLADGFEYDRHQKRKMKQKEGKRSAAAGQPTTPAAPGLRKNFEFVQGKDECASDNFCGVPRPPRVLQGFIFRCDRIRSTEEGVKNHLKARGVSVVEVKQVSRPESTFKSFKVSVEKVVDYNLLLSGTCIPMSCRVRRFIPPRSEHINNNPGLFRSWETSWDSRSSDVAAVRYKQNMEQLNELEAAVTNSITDSVSVEANNANTTTNHPTVSMTVSSGTDQEQAEGNTNVVARKSNEDK